jgi:hypothetical protein
LQKPQRTRSDSHQVRRPVRSVSPATGKPFSAVEKHLVRGSDAGLAAWRVHILDTSRYHFKSIYQYLAETTKSIPLDWRWRDRTLLSFIRLSMIIRLFCRFCHHYLSWIWCQQLLPIDVAGLLGFYRNLGARSLATTQSTVPTALSWTGHGYGLKMISVGWGKGFKNLQNLQRLGFLMGFSWFLIC